MEGRRASKWSKDKNKGSAKQAKKLAPRSGCPRDSICSCELFYLLESSFQFHYLGYYLYKTVE